MTTITGNNDLPAHNLLFHYKAENKKWGGRGNQKNVCEIVKEGKEGKMLCFPVSGLAVREEEEKEVPNKLLL